MRWQLVDKILECEPGIRAKGVKTFPRSDLIFMDHFPGFPIVPGVLQIEMIAQMAGKCAALARPGVLPVLGAVKSAKFYRNVEPGDACIIHVQLEKLSATYLTASGRIEVDGRKVASAEILFGLVERSRTNSESFDAVTQDWLKREGLGAAP